MGEKDAEAWEVLELVCGVLNETGTILKRLGKRSLGEWVEGELTETEADEGEMVRRLAETFPAFRDAHTVDGERECSFFGSTVNF